jgi:hypothetical protein
VWGDESDAIRSKQRLVGREAGGFLMRFGDVPQALKLPFWQFSCNSTPSLRTFSLSYAVNLSD